MDKVKGKTTPPPENPPAPQQPSQSFGKPSCSFRCSKFFLMVVISILIIALGVGGYLVARPDIWGTNNKRVPAQTPISTTNEKLSRVSTSPSVSPKKVVLLSDAWNSGTKTYSNPSIGITFEYPSYFEVQETDIQKANQEWADQYKNIPFVKQPLYMSDFAASFSTPEIEIKNLGNDEDYTKRWLEFCDNKIAVSVSKYQNDKNLPLFDFIAELKKTYTIDGKTMTFDDYKQNLKTTSLPQEGSYVFEGDGREDPVKTVYFINNEQVYTFNLIGICDTREYYNPSVTVQPTNFSLKITGTQIVALGARSIDAYDELGNHTGPVGATGLIEQSIPGSAYHEIDQEIATVALIGGRTYTVKVNASGIMPVEIEVTRSTDTRTLTYTFYNDIVTTDRTVIRLTGDPFVVDTWELDKDGDGTTFVPVRPSSVFTPSASAYNIPPAANKIFENMLRSIKYL